MIALSAESTIDLTPELLNKYGIKIVHFHLEKEGVTYLDNEFTNEELFEFTKTTGKLCHTAAVNIEELENHFQTLKRSGADQIIHFTISSGLSSGYPNAVVASHEDPNIFVLDSHGTSGEIALLAIYAYQLIQKGKSFEEIKKELLRRRENAKCSFIIDTLYFLQKGGRCSKLALFGANLLHIKPVILCDKEGKFIIGKKYRGTYTKCVINYVKDHLASYPVIDKSMCFINYSTAEESDLKMIQDYLYSFGFQQVVTTKACPTNSYHAGPKALGVQFLTDLPEE